jgi:hypothetical protein
VALPEAGLVTVAHQAHMQCIGHFNSNLVVGISLWRRDLRNGCPLLVMIQPGGLFVLCGAVPSALAPGSSLARVAFGDDGLQRGFALVRQPANNIVGDVDRTRIAARFNASIQG